MSLTGLRVATWKFYAVGVIVCWTSFGLAQEYVNSVAHFEHHTVVTLIQHVVFATLAFCWLQHEQRQKRGSAPTAQSVSSLPLGGGPSSSSSRGGGEGRGERDGHSSRVKSRGSRLGEDQTVLGYYAATGVVTLLMRGSINVALRTIPFTTKVLFVSSRHVPMMALGCLFQKTYSILEYLTAVVQALSLVVFSSQDAAVAAAVDTTLKTQGVVNNATVAIGPGGSSDVDGTMTGSGSGGEVVWMGIMFMALSTVCDALRYNLNGRILGRYKRGVVELMAYSNFVATFVWLPVTAATNQLMPAMIQFWHQPSILLLIIGMYLVGFLAAWCVLQLIRTTNAYTASVCSLTQQAVSMLLSFVVYTKPFHTHHAVGCLAFFAATAYQTKHANGGSKPATAIPSSRSKEQGRFDGVNVVDTTPDAEKHWRRRRKMTHDV